MSRIPIHNDPPPSERFCPHGEDCVLLYKVHRFLDEGEESERWDNVESYVWCVCGGFILGILTAFAMA